MTQAERLKELRISRGLSQRDLSKQTGVSKSGISKLESGESNGTVDVLKILANFYDVSLDYITCNPGATSLVDDIIKAFVAKKIIIPGEPIPKETREMLMNIVEDALKAQRSQS